MEYKYLKKYGLDQALALKAGEYDGLHPARIISQSRTLYTAMSETGELMAEISGKLGYSARSASDYPAVGDFVMLDRDSDAAGNAVIHSVLPRKSAFIRKAAGTADVPQVVAANIDTVFICISLNRDFNLRRLERYLAIGWESGATPVVVLTKADLCEDISARLREIEKIAMGAEILVTSSMETDGYRAVLKYLDEGKTAAFMGSSGVGKSTLINRLLGQEMLETNGLRNDDKGRHTTTRRELILLPCGGMVIDTPGMRELGMYSAGEGLERSFEDVNELIASCRFHDCGHNGEPGCAVDEALNSGVLARERWEAYLKLKQENAYAEDRAGYMAKKEQWGRDIAKYNRTNKKK